MLMRKASTRPVPLLQTAEGVFHLRRMQLGNSFSIRSKQRVELDVPLKEEQLPTSGTFAATFVITPAINSDQLPVSGLTTSVQTLAESWRQLFTRLGGTPVTFMMPSMRCYRCIINSVSMSQLSGSSFSMAISATILERYEG